MQKLMEVVVALPFLAYMGERLAEKLIKPLIKAVSPYFGINQDTKDYVEALVCAVPGFAMSMFAGLDLFTTLGVPLAQPWGFIFTAVAVGFGANLVHDLLGYLDTLRGAVG